MKSIHVIEKRFRGLEKRSLMLQQGESFLLNTTGR